MLPTVGTVVAHSSTVHWHDYDQMGHSGALRKVLICVLLLDFLSFARSTVTLAKGRRRHSMKRR